MTIDEMPAGREMEIFSAAWRSGCSRATCSGCDKSGDCRLQDYAYRYQADQNRFGAYQPADIRLNEIAWRGPGPFDFANQAFRRFLLNASQAEVVNILQHNTQLLQSQIEALLRFNAALASSVAWMDGTDAVRRRSLPVTFASARMAPTA